MLYWKSHVTFFFGPFASIWWMSLKLTESLHGSAIPLIYPYCVLHELAEGVPHDDDTILVIPSCEQLCIIARCTKSIESHSGLNSALITSFEGAKYGNK